MIVVVKSRVSLAEPKHSTTPPYRAEFGVGLSGGANRRWLKVLALANSKVMGATRVRKKIAHTNCRPRIDYSFNMEPDTLSSANHFCYI